MSAIPPIGPGITPAYSPLANPIASPAALPDGLKAASSPPDGFGNMLENLVGIVDQKQAAADAATTQVLLGNSGQLHQSVIAMQEASTALSLMVTVRNKLVESYQELMRMQV